MILFFDNVWFSDDHYIHAFKNSEKFSQSVYAVTYAEKVTSPGPDALIENDPVTFGLNVVATKM
jgi:hypothetical protein